MSHPQTQTERPPAVIVGLDGMTGLQTARILARHRIPVIALAANTRHACARTRVCRRILPASHGGAGLLHALERLGPTLPDKAVLFPCTDQSVQAISRGRGALSRWYHIALPPHDVVDMLMDKDRFRRFAREHSLPIPRTETLASRADAERAARDMAYPCVLKPPMKTPVWEENSPAKVFRVGSADEFLAAYDRAAGWTDEIVAQEWVEGPDAALYSFNGYFNADSEPLVTFIARKLRQWPPGTGTSCLGEECRNDEVLDMAVRLFRVAGFHGLAYVEAKRDARTGHHYLIEANPGRPTGRSAIAEAGGVDLLYTAYCDAVGEALPANRAQTYGGARWIYLRRDLQSAFHYWRRGDLSLGDWARSLKGRKTDALFAWDDPAPFWHDLARAVGLAARGRQPKYRRSTGARTAGREHAEASR